ncbi:hypothetical protein [Rhodococcus sp. AG1013]|uniref:hypothetical protein n=1 Tax=unclassified Rhodococcus (in: high G+C Gram-positive bacteria) TaxID=192944 RepID=UPI000E0A1073|nr:hypothetical protein [Rhodococcus sp. AG1013]RDI24785.1 hypothetical protein DEU38_1104 [Rhodococcus sp. AG1013]
MQLVVNEFGAVLLEDRDTFTDFAVRAPADYEIVRVGKALEAAWVGEAVDGHAWISAAAVARLADADGAGDDWRTGFQAMREYARGKGWVRADGAIRAHIEHY